MEREKTANQNVKMLNRYWLLAKRLIDAQFWLPPRQGAVHESGMD